MHILGQLAGLASLVCFIIVLIKLFKAKGALHGILGILSCGLYPFIWGWMNATTLNIKNIMILWSILWVVAMILNFMFPGAAISQMQTAP